jgi:hypothetical protein
MIWNAGRTWRMPFTNRASQLDREASVAQKVMIFQIIFS